MTLDIDEAHSEALERINNSFYQNEDLGDTIQDMIREHLFREGGRLGNVHLDPDGMTYHYTVIK